MATIQRFIIQAGERAGKTVELDSFPFTIGRARECNYILDHTEISRLHAQLHSEHLNVLLEDMNSTNGTFVNGRRLGPDEQYRLRAGDVVNFAKIAEWVFDDPVTTAQIDPVDLPLPGLELDVATARVTISGIPLYPPLSPNQFALLAVLYAHKDRIVSREEVIAQVWGDEEDVSDQTIDALVSRLRKRLHEVDPHHEYLVTRRGFGLMFQNRS